MPVRRRCEGLISISDSLQTCKVFPGQHTIVVVIVVVILTASIAIAISIVAPPKNFTLVQAGSQGRAEIMCQGRQRRQCGGGCRSSDKWVTHNIEGWLNQV